MSRHGPKAGIWGLARGAAPALAAGLLAACTVGPRYAPPAPDVPAGFSQVSVAEPDIGAWWRGFGDPTLDSLVARALALNLDIRQSAARIAEARQQVRIAGAAGQPTLSADAQASYTKLSKNTSIGNLASLLGGGGGSGQGSAGLPGTEFETYQLGFDASWELDVFGGVRRSVEAARARASAAEWSLRDAQVMLVAELVHGYLQYRALDQRIALADQAVETRDQALDFQQVRQRHGLTTTPEVRRAQQDLAAEDAIRDDLIAQRQAQAHAMALLLGDPPLALDRKLAAPAAAALAPTDVPVGLPSDLLRRRPDIRAAERRLAAATADVGVATADLYPRISLTGGANLVSSSLSTLIAADSFQPNVAAALMAPLLDGGRRRASVDLRRAQAREAALAYQAVVLAALRDVEDALSRLQADRDRERQLAAGEAAARDAASTAQVRARAGLTNALEALDARVGELAASDSLAQAQAARRQDLVALYKALGGGWDASPQSIGQEP
jgi:NodT family efflux transporter outer membrane factor (OMF) lipoprotein